MAVARCFVTRKLPGDAIARLADVHEVELHEAEEPPSRERLLSAVADAEGLLCLLTEMVDAELLDAAPGLRAIANMAVGTDNIDLEECRRRGIPVGNTPGVLTQTTADLAFALILASARRICEGAAAVRAGEWRSWEPGGWLGRDVHGATLGIIGGGAIGRAVARRASGFSMRVLINGGPTAPGTSMHVSLDQLLRESDFVTLHAPLNDRTRGLIGKTALKKMKPTAILVNTARGEIVNTEALRHALIEGWIAGAALDVTDPEPLPPDHPLLEAPNLTVVPHIGSASVSTREAMAEIAVENLLAALDGEPMPFAVT